MSSLSNIKAHGISAHDADATGHEKQLWQLLASPGHVLLERMRVIVETKPHIRGAWLIVWSIFLTIVLTIAFIFMQPGLSHVAKKAASGISSVVVNTGTPAPTLKRVRPIAPQLAIEQVRGLTSVVDARSWIDASFTRISKLGLPPEFCVDGKPLITESWLVKDGSQPACRITKDRIWVWAVVKQGSDEYPQPVPLFGLFRREKDGQPWIFGLFRREKDGQPWAFYSVAESGAQLPGYASISMSDIPRTAVQDFPELKE